MKLPRILLVLLLLPVLAGFAKKPRNERAIKIATHQTASWKAYYYNDLEKYAKEMQSMYEVMFNIKDATKIREAMTIAVQAFAALPKHTRYDLLQRVVLPRIRKVYEAIQTETQMTFDIEKVSQAQLDLWRVRRHNQIKGLDALVPYMAKYLSSLWGKNPEDYHRAAYFMLAAMDLRHFCKHEQGKFLQDDWQYIKAALINHHNSLDEALANSGHKNRKS